MTKQPSEINDKAERIMEGVNVWCSFYRANPHRFAKDYLGVDLKLFQKIILFMMNKSVNFIYIASRGQGKTYITALFSCIRCILYPNTKICIAASSRDQALLTIKVIMETFFPNSDNLKLEIKDWSLSSTNGFVSFKNGSNIKIVTSSDSARGNRANVLIIDEFRWVDKDVIDKVFKPFLASTRATGYLNKPEYANIAERNRIYYLSSAGAKSEWSWEKVQAVCVDMVNENKQAFVCSLPYQLSVKENLLMKEEVIDRMTEPDFDELHWSMEMEALFFGESEQAFFQYSDLMRVRKIKTALYPDQTYNSFNKIIKRQVKQPGEIRLLCADIAVMSSKKKNNDATAIFILQLIPTKDGQYLRNVLYCETYEGGHTESQAIIIRRLFEEMDCDYIVIDTAGVGIGVYDNLVKDLFDVEHGIEYPALTCINDSEMAARYKGSSLSPKRVIYSIKASVKLNSECAASLRDCLKRGKMSLLITEQEFEEEMKKNKAYENLSINDKFTLKMPYIQTTLLISELVNLEYTMANSQIKIYENSDKRKDRYTSLAYGNYFANELERKTRRTKPSKNKFDFLFRAPKIK